jgi:ParB family transcriptional regulator, chromosome partitioning protein
VTRPEPGIGRGLQAILSASSNEAGTRAEELRELPLELIAPNPKQPRRRFDEESLQGLALSVRERGVLQPVLVRPKAAGGYELVAGERRWHAARMAGLDTIPAIVHERADAEALELALIENMAREDLSPIEAARACAALVDELGLTREELGRRVGRSRVSVSNLLRLLELPEEAIELLHQGALSEGHGRALLIADDHGARRTLARRAAAEAWSVRTAEARARASNAASAENGSAPRRRISTRAHADQEHAVQQIAEALGQALGADVHVKAMRDGAYRAELTFENAEEALGLAQRLRALALVRAG